MEFLWLHHVYGDVFFVCSFRVPIVELSFFLSKNFAEVFFESTIASFDQSLCSGSPRGSMNLCNRIWMTELLHFYAYKFLSIIAMQSLWKSKHEKTLSSACTTASHVTVEWAKYICCNGRSCEGPIYGLEYMYKVILESRLNRCLHC